MRQPDNQQIAAMFDTIAARYDRLMGSVERWLFPGSRAWVVARARGRVVEIGVGTGLNLARYGPGVAGVIGIDVSEQMLAVARQRVIADGLARAGLCRGDAQALGLPDGIADTVVSTFTFCMIPDPLAASREAYRVLASGGRFVLSEHGPSAYALGRGIMRAIEPVSVRIAAEHLMRDPVPYLETAGFTVNEVHRTGRLGIAFHVLATKNVARTDTPS